jgi:hypothetical protein
MQLILKKTLKAFLGGLTVSTLFFFPLINTLSGSNIDALHWNTQDSAETLLSWITLGTLIGGLFYLISCKGNRHHIAFIYMLMINIGGFFAIGTLIRKSELINSFKNNPSAIYTIATIIALLLVALTVWISTTSKTKYSSIPQWILVVLAPLNLLIPLNISIAQVNVPSSPPILESPVNEIATSLAPSSKPLTIILLFDELSPDYLYGSRKVSMEKFPALKTLMSNSQIFTNAYLPGGNTAESIPAFFDYKSKGNSLKELLTHQRLNAALTGWYLDYCRMIVKKLNECKSFSFFNARTLENKFSLLHPIWTNLNLLPYQKPFGFLKIPTATTMHTRTLAEINRHLHENINNENLDLVYTHFNIPHAPMLGSENFSWADRGRFDENENSYIKQLGYVDQSIGLAIDQINLISKRRPVNLIIISDHNIRKLTPKSEHEHTVLIFKPFNGPEIKAVVDQQRINSAEFINQILN